MEKTALEGSHPSISSYIQACQEDTWLIQIDTQKIVTGCLLYTADQRAMKIWDGSLGWQILKVPPKTDFLYFPISVIRFKYQNAS